MPRYFIDVAYKGTNYCGSQKQQNANSIQSEIETALKIFFRQPFNLTGASRTDAGVHALQNFFHFDSEYPLKDLPANTRRDLGDMIYSLNAILPQDISVSKLSEVNKTAHCRYDALEREYKYFIYFTKDPFFNDRAYFYPYKIHLSSLRSGAEIISNYQDFTSFSKRSVQVNNFFCSIYKSYWTEENNMLVYTVSGNRFLRGMVRGLVATMLKLGRGILSEEQFEKILSDRNSAQADFSAPSQGLFLNFIRYSPALYL